MTSADPWAEIRAEAETALRYAMAWELTSEHWAEFAEIVEIAIAAHAADDVDAFAQAVGHLELVGPLRVGSRIGLDAPCEPPPGPVRERVDHLIRVLDAGRDR